MLKINLETSELLYDNVLVKPISITTAESIKTKDGTTIDLARPQGYEDKAELGEVIGYGEGRIFDNGTVIPLKVKKGDLVYFNKYSSVKIRFDTNDYLLIREEDIQIILRD